MKNTVYLSTLLQNRKISSEFIKAFYSVKYKLLNSLVSLARIISTALNKQIASELGGELNSEITKNLTSIQQLIRV